MTRIFAVVAALLFCASAEAQQFSRPVGPSTYFTARLGAFLPQHDDIKYLDNGFEGEVALGMYLSPSLAAELGIGYFGAKGEVSGYVPDLGMVVTEKDELRVIPFTGTIRAILPVDRLSLSALVGVGLYQTRIKATISELGLSGSDSATAFGAHIGAGAGVQLAPTTTLGVELRYVLAQASFDGGDIGLNGVRMGAALSFGF